MLPVAIIGGGKIADQHVRAIPRVHGCEVVAGLGSQNPHGRTARQAFQDCGRFLRKHHRVFCFSTQIKPGLKYLRLYGPKKSCCGGSKQREPFRLASVNDKSCLTYSLRPLRTAKNNFKNALTNVTSFLQQELYQDFGLKTLIEGFYLSIRGDDPLPIPYREIIQTAPRHGRNLHAGLPRQASEFGAKLGRGLSRH